MIMVMTKCVSFDEDEFVRLQKSAARNQLSFSDEVRRRLDMEPMKLHFDKIGE
jgi:hypothetical protein